VQFGVVKIFGQKFLDFFGPKILSSPIPTNLGYVIAMVEDIQNPKLETPKLKTKGFSDMRIFRQKI